MFQSCLEGDTASLVSPVLLGSKCALLKDTTRFDPSGDDARKCSFDYQQFNHSLEVKSDVNTFEP